VNITVNTVMTAATVSSDSGMRPFTARCAPNRVGGAGSAGCLCRIVHSRPRMSRVRLGARVVPFAVSSVPSNVARGCEVLPVAPSVLAPSRQTRSRSQSSRQFAEVGSRRRRWSRVVGAVTVAVSLRELRGDASSFARRPGRRRWRRHRAARRRASPPYRSAIARTPARVTARCRTACRRPSRPPPSGRSSSSSGNETISTATEPLRAKARRTTCVWSTVSTPCCGSDKRILVAVSGRRISDWRRPERMEE
jgi:hypothetical protein